MLRIMQGPGSVAMTMVGIATKKIPAVISSQSQGDILDANEPTKENRGEMCLLLRPALVFKLI